VSKHTTCGDVDEGGVKRLLEVPGCRCLRRDVDVGAVILARTRHAKTEIRTDTLMPENLEQKGLTKVVKICVKITPDFVAKESNRCQKGYYGIRTGEIRCMPALAGVTASYFWSESR
jgi:hypothetical protein